MLPLYRNNGAPEKLVPDSKANLGLWYTRFFDRFQSGDTTVKPVIDECEVPEGEKQAWIKNTAAFRFEEKTINTVAERIRMLCTSRLGEFRIFKIDWHFATGLGINHPVENGFSWHHTLGVPYLCGAAVKGLVRAWVESWAESSTSIDDNGAPAGRDISAKEDDISGRLSGLDQCLWDWFGSVSATTLENWSQAKQDWHKRYKENNAGCLVFFDALPIGQVTLTADVMTPHMGKWYERGGNDWLGSPIQVEADRSIPPSDRIKYKNAERVPADWHDPTPIPFLTVKEAFFQFAIAPRLTGNPEHDKFARDASRQALDALQNALEWLGAGAKTAVGYGRMSRSTTKEGELAEKLSLALEQARKQAVLDATPEHERIVNEFLTDTLHKQNTDEHKRDPHGYTKLREKLMQFQTAAVSDQSSSTWPTEAIRYATKLIHEDLKARNKWITQLPEQHSKDHERIHTDTHKFIDFCRHFGIDISE